MTTTWSPSNKIGTVVLSNGNLTAAALNDGAATFQGGFATAGVGAGEKKAWSTKMTALPTAVSNVQIGFCTAAWVMNTFGGVDNTSSVQYKGDAHLFVNGAGIAVSNAWNLNSVLDFQIDRIINRAWPRVDGTVWASGGDPAAGTGGIDISGMVGTLFPCYCLLGDAGGVATIVGNFGATAAPFAFSAGFSTFDTIPPPPPPDPGGPPVFNLAKYNLAFAVETLFPGVVVQAPLMQAAYTQVVAKNAPLDSTDVVTILTAANVIIAAQKLAGYVPTTEPAYPLVLPTYPTGLPRFPDAYGGMTTPDGWNRTWAGKVVEA